MRKIVVLILIFLFNIFAIFPQEQIAPILTDENVRNFIVNWDNLSNDFNNSLADNESVIYFNKINWFIYGLTDCTIFMLGYSDDELQKAALKNINEYKKILNMEVSDEVNSLYLKNNIRNGHKIYFALTIGAILVGIEKIALFEENNPDNTMHMKLILENVKAHLPMLNQNDLSIVANYLHQLPPEINRYYYNIEE